ncbi:MAG: Uncharacterized protein AUREO_024160 [Aureobasidium pullulans]|uniref:BZIP domain-containing protein n=1 Tax=Aureobasidium pullulans TaxID=5580 RepID=A0AB74JH40_AURPU|nr:MAG: Uncharacterized protein AUREO_024160 [Aureobasidium pullulans]THX21961.1 hypothetical protein D6D12_09578 [Aureobasidium pullulans]THX64333.1 hypothetical protein D6D11_01231 [Aureobasidium pullulans]
MSDNEKMESSSSPVSAAPQSPSIGEPSTTSNNNINHNTIAQSPSLSQSAKKGRGRPRKYHTDAEREEAKRRYRENHKTKAASGGGVSNSGNASASANFVVAAQPKQQDIDDLWEAMRGLQEEVAGLKMQLAQRDAAAANAAAALPGQKRRKV